MCLGLWPALQHRTVGDFMGYGMTHEVLEVLLEQHCVESDLICRGTAGRGTPQIIFDIDGRKRGFECETSQIQQMLRMVLDAYTYLGVGSQPKLCLLVIERTVYG